MEILQLKVSNLAGTIATPFRFIPRTFMLYRENRELNHALFILNQENTRLREFEAENHRLREMLHFVDRKELNSIPAMVVGKSAGGHLRHIVLDRGSADGLERGFPVMSATGLVGQIAVLDSQKSLCQLMLDGKFGAAVKVQRNRIDGIIHYDSGDLCRLDGIPFTLEVRVGDTLITSGLGGIYPKGLNVGLVSKVTKDQSRLFQEILVKPFTDFRRLEEVFVLIP